MAAVLPQCAFHVTGARGVAPLSSDPPASWKNVTPLTGPNPLVRYQASLGYDPSAHEDILFGGYGELGNGPWVNFQDTWAFANGQWSELIANTTCTPSTCPSPRAGAMLAYEGGLGGMVLFGGYHFNSMIVPILNDDTWLFANGAWTNLTASVGAAPPARFDGSMVWDSLDNYILLFGGFNQTYHTLGDTWKFGGVTWANISSSVGSAPSPRAGAAIANSPSGWVMLFGGENPDGTAITDVGGCTSSAVNYWFHSGKWVQIGITPTCINTPPTSSPGLAAGVTSTYPPCGRYDAALGWSPPNNRFVLFGGIGPTGPACTGFSEYVNGTWSYQNSPGGAFYWQNATDPGFVGDPPIRFEMGYTSDFTSNYFEIFGGYGGQGGGRNDTWRFNELVHAKLTGPSVIDTNASHLTFNVPFTVTGYGGSNNLEYTFRYFEIRNSNLLIDGGHSYCGNLTGTANYALPYVGVANVYCTPTPQSYNVYRLEVWVYDVDNVTLSGVTGLPTNGAWATANWTFTVAPPTSAILYSQYVKYFYTGFNWNNIFGAYLKLAGQAPVSVTASLGGTGLTFLPRAAGSFWWNSTPINMGNVTPGSVLRVTGVWNDWTVNVTYTPNMIKTPSWLNSLFTYTDAATATPTAGKGPYNKTYAIYENYSWSVGSSSSFALPAPMLSGKYSLIPAISVAFSASSSATLGISGTLTENLPKIDFGVASLQLSVAATLSGKFAIENTSQGLSDVQWVNAKATLTLAGDLGANIPIYGFDVLGVDVGFTLKLDVKISLALTLLLTPTTVVANEIISGVQAQVSQLLGSVTLALSAAVSFGIGFASVAIGITTSIALAFNITPSFHVGGGWLNGTFFAQATFICWTATWNIVGPGVIASFSNTGPLAPAPGTQCPGPTCYNTGVNATWNLQPRYYVTSGYDAIVWNANLSEGPAASDVYPHTEVTGAAAYNGGDLFYSDDNPQLPVSQGLHVSGLHLNSSTNRLAATTSPSDPGFVIDHPVATTLSDGSLYVVWAAVPTTETSLASPADLTSLALHGARYYPSNDTWGPVRAWTSWGFSEAYQLEGTSAPGSLVVVVAPTWLPGDATVERLVEFNLASGAVVSNVSVTGLSQVTSLRGGLGEAVFEDIGGNYSVRNLTTGATVTVTISLPAGSHLVSESFATYSPSILVLLFRNPNATETVLYDLRTGLSVATLATDQSAISVEAVDANGLYYVFESVQVGVEVWTEAAGRFSNLTLVPEANLESFGVVQAGSSLVVYSLLTNGAPANATVTLALAEIPASLPEVVGRPSPSSPPPPPKPPTANSTTVYVNSTNPVYLEYLAIAAVAVGGVLAVIAVVTRRRPKSPWPMSKSESSTDSPPPPGDGPP
jgi:Galactose oxidase, central domain